MKPDAQQPGAVELDPGVRWVGTEAPAMRDFAFILKTADGTPYNACCVRGARGVAVIEDRRRGLKRRVPVKGVKAKLVPTKAERAQCWMLGHRLAQYLTGRAESRSITLVGSTRSAPAWSSRGLPSPWPSPPHGRGGRVRR